MASVEKTYTLEDFIDAGKISSVLSYTKMTLKIKDTDGTIYPIYNVMNDYSDELKTLSIKVALSDLDMSRYKYRPKLLAYEIYGATELFYLILLLNDMSSPKQFDKNTIRMIRPEDISDILSYIYGAEQPNIIKNRSKYDLDIYS